METKRKILIVMGWLALAISLFLFAVDYFKDSFIEFSVFYALFWALFLISLILFMKKHRFGYYMYAFLWFVQIFEINAQNLVFQFRLLLLSVTIHMPEISPIRSVDVIALIAFILVFQTRPLFLNPKK